MFFAFNPKQATKLARALEKSLTHNGIELAHGQALDTLARMAGFANWNAWSASMGEKALNSALMKIEVEHIRGYEDCDYGPEVALVAHTGFELRYAQEGELLEYVRVCDPLGREIAYWDHQEWADDPQLVMGAILGALVRGQPAIVKKSGTQLPRRASVASVKVSAPRVPLITELDFFKTHAVVFGGRCYRIEWREEAALAYVGNTELEDYEDWAEETALSLHYEEDGLVWEESVTVDQLTQLNWDAAKKCFVSPDGEEWRFFVESEFGVDTLPPGPANKSPANKAAKAEDKPAAKEGSAQKAPKRYEVTVAARGDDGTVTHPGVRRYVTQSKREACALAREELWDDRLTAASCRAEIDAEVLDDDEEGPFTIFIDGGEYDTVDSFSKAWRVAQFMLDETAEASVHIENAQGVVELRLAK